MGGNRSQFRRPIRFNRTRANPIQRLPFYRQSHAKTGDYWRMPDVDGYLMGREVGRLCSIAFVQAFAEALEAPQTAGMAHLADIVTSAIESNGGSLTERQRGLVDGFFGNGSRLVDVLSGGARSASLDHRYTVQQLESALTKLSCTSTEDYALARIGPGFQPVPCPKCSPPFELVSNDHDFR